MAVSISSEVQQLVEREFSLGTYESTDDVLLEAVCLLRDRNNTLRELREAILPALESLDRGEGRPLDMARIKAEAQQKFDAARAARGPG